MCHENNSLALVEDEITYDLDDLILFEVGESVRALAALFRPKVFHLCGTIIDIPKEDPNMGFEDRLAHIINLASQLQSYWTYEAVTSKLLEADGWHVGKYSLRTPLWMFDHRELTIEEACKIEGLQWLMQNQR
jgi:hypothetical protein